ncbi:MAG: PAS domain-containing protein [Candidatus Omnitrophica bacterium]|nr:PAS domain-containing protein [Candidatus Omnitrophota bacterium]MBU1785176.1 PAS domain-containing protein [Candidatus Omnitrophota bacterium]MBU1851154.1 PAS domain-containing protein [Candidatus Omnitrophota bacterium]
MTDKNTERKELEKKLKDSESRYRTLTDDVLDRAKVGLFILDRDFRVVWVNSAMERYFALRRENIIGKNKRQLIEEEISCIFEHPEIYKEKVFATYDDNTYVENFKCHVLPAEGRAERWLEHNSAPIETGIYAGGRIEQYYDITERKDLENKMEEHIARLERQKLEIEHKNVGFKEIVREIHEEKIATKNAITQNINVFVKPILEKLRMKGASHKYVNVLQGHLEDLVSSFGRRVTQVDLKLTPREIEICGMIRGNLDTKEIAILLNVAPQTVSKHRKDIRKKIGLSNQKTNLTSYLQNL